MSPPRRISLIMPARNEGPMVRRTVDSLLANTFYPDYELLLLDDASDDGCCDFMLEPPYADDARLRLIRGDGLRRSIGLRVEGARLATGSILQFLDAHLCFSPCWLENLQLALERRGYRGIVGPAVSVINPETWSMTSTMSYGWTTSPDLARIGHIGRGQVGADGWVPWFGATQIMIARETYDEIGGFCGLYSKYGNYDRDICMRAYLLGHDCHVEPSAVIGHFFKREFRSPITWTDVAYNCYLLAWLTLGEEGVARLLDKQTHGRAEGLEMLEGSRAEIAAMRAWIVGRQRRSPEEYFARAPGLPE